MRTGHRRLALVAALCALGFTAMAPAALSASPRGGEGDYLVDGAAIRPEPNRSKGPIGSGYVAHQVDMHCGAYGEEIDGRSDWYFHTDVTTGVTGWTHGSAVDPYSDYLPEC
ncbi:hypothetical protein GCM10027271_16330 [Saccharopolyspora gloriosae]|uniref:SH3 domain-containing protein n=1 Tax=Saccharopolyspora gloriosae TaxID=455344 RepID=A0A840N6A0_9PSEU|nr:hypothetical protein [Saccharopolyspora gloriosae]MBB5067184.1 hypothetical protein [Saccharopolyspora gloriosae]